MAVSGCLPGAIWIPRPCCASPRRPRKNSGSPISIRKRGCRPWLQNSIAIECLRSADHAKAAARVFTDDTVCRDEDKLLYSGLRNQHAIERVGVDLGQFI